MDVQEWDDQHELTYSNYVRTQDVTLKTCRRRCVIGRNGERGSGISALAARHDDDDELCAKIGSSDSFKNVINKMCLQIIYIQYIYIYIYIYIIVIMSHQLLGYP